MIFDIKFISALIFFSLCFAIIFLIRNRTALVSSLIIAYLNLILFLSLSITNYNLFKEITLIIAAYLMLILFLITNYDTIKQNSYKPLKIKDQSAIKIIVIFIFFIFFSALLYLTNSAFYSMKNWRLNNINPSASKAIAENIENNANSLNAKKIYLQKKIEQNYLLKNSSDIILIIIAATTISLALQRKKNI